MLVSQALGWGLQGRAIAREHLSGPRHPQQALRAPAAPLWQQRLEHKTRQTPMFQQDEWALGSRFVE